MKVLANQFDRLGFITLGLLNRALDRQHFGLRLAGRMSWISCGVVSRHGKFNCLVEPPEQTRVVTNIDNGDAFFPHIYIVCS